MLSPRLVRITLAASLLLVLAACGGTEATATSIGREDATDAGADSQTDAGDAADAAAWSLGVVASDVLEIAVTGGLPAGCPGQGYRAAARFYRLDLAAGTLHVTSYAACLDDAGAEPPGVELDVTLSAADRDTVVSLAEALTGEIATRELCAADAPDESLKILHRDGSDERWPVRRAPCSEGFPRVHYQEYGALRAKLDALLH